MTAFVNNYTKDKIQTEDIVQETFIKLWNVRKTLNPKTSITGFLYKTAYHNFIDNYRKEKHKLSMLDNWMYQSLMNLKKENTEITEKKIKYLLEAIEKLPPKCKKVFILSKYENLKYNEISKKLGISIKTVESQMSRAFSLIRKEISLNKEINSFFTSYLK